MQHNTRSSALPSLSLAALAALTALLGLAGCGGSTAPTLADGTNPHGQNPSGQSSSPSALLDPGGSVVAITTTSTQVCWNAINPASKESTIACAPKAGGAVSVLHRGSQVHSGLLAADDVLFFSSEGERSLRALPASGGAPMTILSNGGPQGRFTLSDGLAMWIDATRSGVFVSSANGSTTTMQSSDNKIADAVGLDSDLIAAVSPSVYAYPTVFSFGIGVVRVNPSGEPVQLSGECFYPLDLAAGGGRVFWTCEDNTFHWTSQAGGDADHVITDVLSSTIAVNGRGDAFLADAMEGRVMRLRAGATSMDVVMQGLTRPTAIAADEGAVYVADASGLRIVALP